MSHTDNEKREAPWSGPEMGGPELVVQFTDSLASLRLLSTSSLAIVPRDISPLSIAADTSASVATGTLAIAIFMCSPRNSFEPFHRFPDASKCREIFIRTRNFESELSFFLPPLSALFLSPRKTIHRALKNETERGEQIVHVRVMKGSWNFSFSFPFFRFTRKGKVSRERERRKEGLETIQRPSFFFIERRDEEKVESLSRWYF